MGLIRTVHPDTLAALEGVFHPIVMIYLDWPDATVRMHSGSGDLSWDGHTWTGLGTADGSFVGVSIPDEAGGLASQPGEVRLIGGNETLDGYLDDPIRDRDGWIAFATVTQRQGNLLIGEPIEAFVGYMDALRDLVEVQRDGEVVEVRRDVVLQLGDGPSQRTSATVYHTDEDQRRHHPGDTAGRHVINAEARAATDTWPE